MSQIQLHRCIDCKKELTQFGRQGRPQKRCAKCKHLKELQRQRDYYNADRIQKKITMWCVFGEQE